jgi:predicted nucleic acid-binding protein
VSFDSGVLTALDRREATAWAWMRRAAERGVAPLVSAAAVAEAWRAGQRSWLQSALRGCEIAPVTHGLALAAGIACADVGSETVDAIIAATAAADGAALLTGDPADMQRLTDHFRSLRVIVL